jgi:uncharacterized protein YdeI (YjbR/CyaY-like superfamily)
MHTGRNIVLIGGLRGEFRLGFFNAALMKDPACILEKQGPNSRHPDTIRVTCHARVIELEPVIVSYLSEAMGYADAFHSLTPGRQRSYAINLRSANTQATRTARIAKFRERILSGKGATER